MARPEGPVRAFLAIELPEQVRTVLLGLIERFRHTGMKASWVKPENIHLTLRFLGNVDPTRFEALREDLQARLALAEPFELHVRAVGAFPSPARPRVVWAGVEDPSGQLHTVQAACEIAATSIGLEPEQHAFKPHITLGRLRNRGPQQNLTDALNGEATFDGGDFMPRAVSLFLSNLTPQGANYHRLFDFPIQWTSTSESPTPPSPST